MRVLSDKSKLSKFIKTYSLGKRKMITDSNTEIQEKVKNNGKSKYYIYI
jgi:hypothetical protein